MSSTLPAHMRPTRSFQGLILTLHNYWRNTVAPFCNLRHGSGRRYVPSGDDAVFAGAKALEGGLCAAVAPSERWPLWRKLEPAPALLSVSGAHSRRRQTFRIFICRSLKAIGLDPTLHDVRFVEDDWESPTLGAWGLGWECWCDGMEVSQFTYFRRSAALNVRLLPVN